MELAAAVTDSLGDDFYDPALYERAVGPGFRVDEFYREEAAGHGDVLELGCGIGNVLLPIARDGHTVVGIDSSASMLARFHELLAAEPQSVRERVTLVRADLTSFSPPHTVDQVIAPNDVLAHLLDDAALEQSLSRIRAALRRRGRLLLDWTAFDVVRIARIIQLGPVQRLHGDDDLGDGRILRVYETAGFDQASWILTATFRYEEIRAGEVGKTTYRRLRLRPRPLSELLFAIKAAGFTIECVDSARLPPETGKTVVEAFAP